MRPIELAGKKLGELMVLRRAPNLGRQTRWTCICSCGAMVDIATAQLAREKHVTCCNSCSCKKRGEKFRTHGEAGKTVEYEAWAKMLQRCNNVSHFAYKDYGGRGISVCSSWFKYENFLADMGRRPSSTHSLERRYNNGDYNKDNCLWATITQQASNKRSNHYVVVGSSRLTLSSYARQLGIHVQTLRSRLKRQGVLTSQKADIVLQVEERPQP